MSMEETKFTRRSFLKGAGALGAAAALGGSLAYKPVEAFAEAADVASNTGEKEAIFGYCHMCMSNGNCSYVGTVKDGVVVNLFLMIRYGFAIAEVAQKVQNAVYSALEGMTGFPVKAVNVHVGGISFD